jgi:hypothetical protein
MPTFPRYKVLEELVRGGKAIAARLGFGTAPTIRAALDQAKDVIWPNPNVIYSHWPPLFLCDVQP